MKKKLFIFLVSILLFFIVFNNNNVSANSSDPKVFIQEIVDEVRKILVATNSPEYKAEKLTEIAKAKVDIKGIGLYTLGSYRKKFLLVSPENCSLHISTAFLETSNPT